MFRPLAEKEGTQGGKGAPLLRRSKRRKVPGGQQLNLHLLRKTSKFFSCKNVYGFLIVFLKKEKKVEKGKWKTGTGLAQGCDC